MTALSQFKADAYLASQSKAVKSYVKDLCRITGLSYFEIIRPRSELAKAARTAMICGLANMHLSLNHISKISHLHRLETWRILDQRRKTEQSIRTTNWEAFA